MRVILTDERRWATKICADQPKAKQPAKADESSHLELIFPTPPCLAEGFYQIPSRQSRRVNPRNFAKAARYQRVVSSALFTPDHSK
jgi:hypothetical protein